MKMKTKFSVIVLSLMLCIQANAQTFVLKGG